MKDLILFPFNGNCREAVSVIAALNHQQPEWNVLGFVDDNENAQGKRCGDYPVLGSRERFAHYPEAYVLALPGRAENFQHRSQIIDGLGIPPERFATVIHPTASIGVDCAVGWNSVLMAGVVLTGNVRIGNHCVILPNSVISHESTVEDFTLIGSNVSVSGSVRIRENCYIGTGTKIIHEVEIGRQSMVGLGSVVIRSVPPQTVVAGCPAKPLRPLEATV